MEATVSSPIQRADLSESMTRANNVDWAFTTANYLLNRAPDFFVYIFNISKQEFKVSRPPILKELIIPARKEGEKYALATRLPSPLLVPKGNVDSNEIDINAMDTRRFATDIVNPDNLGIDQDAVIVKPTGQGNNLGAFGVFWSLSATPTEAELKAATARMEKNYRRLLEEARAVEVSRPKDLVDTLSPSHHMAADYFHETFSWHSKPVHKENCPRCGTPATVGAPFHALEGGGLCVGDWDAAIRAGVRSRAQAFEATEDNKYAPRLPKGPVAEK
jgi:hypothetical protein